MKEKVVFITGAKGGLGSFITRRFLETGATVVGASRSISQQDFPRPNFTALAVDFTKAPAVNDAVQSVITRFGRLDVLVHVLGGFAGGQTVAGTDDAAWERMRDLNLTSGFYVLRAAVPYLRKSGRGRIVAIGSLTAVEPHPQLGAYITFKAVLAMLVRTVALENKDAGLTANVVLPISAAGLSRSNDSFPHGSDEPRLLAQEPDPARVEDSAHARVCGLCLARCSRNSWPAAVRNEPTLRSWHRRRAIHCHHATCGR